MKLLLHVLLFPALLALPAFPAVFGEPAAPAFSDPLAIDNPFMPFVPGAVKVHMGRSDGEQTVAVELYLAETRDFVLGGGTVTCAVLQETEFEAGEIVEISLNYFAQADDGSVYYFGEVVDDYEDGVVTGHGGSWLVGGPTLPTDPADTATAAMPALFMPEDPQVGDTWKPEDLFPFVDETVELLDDDATVNVPAGKYEDALQVKETSALAPGFELKWYAPGVGVVKAKGKAEVLRLVASTLLPIDDDDAP